jgi:uncharacterized radical SAM protein YgiQ
MYDVIFVTGDLIYDHPLSGTAVLTRLLESKGYKVAVISQPQNDKDFLSKGKPNYLFCITSGLLDSMLANYTPMLKKREDVRIPERAIISYTQKIKQHFRGSFTVIGGVEATIRRFTHFDYKDNNLRRNILYESKADLLLFGNAERSLLNLLGRMKKRGKPLTAGADMAEALGLKTLDGAAFRIPKDKIDDARMLPSYEDCVSDKSKFNLLARTTYLLPDSPFVEQTGLGSIRHNRPSPPLTEEEMDHVYSLPFTRKLQGPIGFKSMLQNFENSVILGRGCWGGCNFCIIPLVQGKNIAKRSRGSVIKEIESLYVKGNRKINDLTMPTINMYGSYCDLYREPEKMVSAIIEKEVIVYNKKEYCNQECVGCSHRKLSDDLYQLLEGVQKLIAKHHGELEIRSAIRHDLILSQKKLFRKVMEFTERLKIAPEHISDTVLRSMNKGDKKAFQDFLKEYEQVNKEQKTRKRLIPYFVAAHPGSQMKDMQALKDFCETHSLEVSFTQVFTPTPGTMSTAMYYTGIDPKTKKEVYVPRTFREKKDQKNLLLSQQDGITDESA